MYVYGSINRKDTLLISLASAKDIEVIIYSISGGLKDYVPISTLFH